MDEQQPFKPIDTIMAIAAGILLSLALVFLLCMLFCYKLWSPPSLLVDAQEALTPFLILIVLAALGGAVMLGFKLYHTHTLMSQEREKGEWMLTEKMHKVEFIAGQDERVKLGIEAARADGNPFEVSMGVPTFLPHTHQLK